ncbi:MAG: CoB--CoM heterodisulfide reductase subunit C [Candidatus Bathyarchaeia archaeon]
MNEKPKPPVQIDKMDKEFLDTIIKAGAEKINVCIQCGTCTSSCPSGRRTALKTRQLMRKGLLGLKDEILNDKDLWLCTTCYTCLERCPRGVDPTDVILTMRRMAVQAGNMLDPHKRVAGLVIKFGHAVPIDEATRKLRTTMNLGENPPTVHAYPEALKEVQEIIRKKGFDKLVCYEWK